MPFRFDFSNLLHMSTEAPGMLTGEERRLASRRREESTEVFRERYLHSVCFRVLASFQPTPI